MDSQFERAHTYISNTKSFPSPSPFLFYSRRGRLHPCQPIAKQSPLHFRAKTVCDEMHTTISKRYPCSSAVSSVLRDEYHVGLYYRFGDGSKAKELVKDISYFVARSHISKFEQGSFWAVFDDQRLTSEKDFDQKLMFELNALSKVTDGIEVSESTQGVESASITIEGKRLFVLGMHALSSRMPSRFPWPTLVFNTFDQFDLFREVGFFHRAHRQFTPRGIAFCASDIRESLRLTNQPKSKGPLNILRKIFSS